MKFKNFLLSLALMITVVPVAKGDSCGNFPFFDFEQFIKTVTGIKCFENKNIEKDYGEICGCMKDLPKDSTKDTNERNILFAKARATIDANHAAYLLNYKKNQDQKPDQETEKKNRKLIRLIKEFTEKNVPPTELDVLNAQSLKNGKEQSILREKNLIDYEKSLIECGYPLDEFRRMSRIPDIQLINEAFQGEDHDNQGTNALWADYLNKNPNLKAIDENLDQPKKMEFRSQMVNRMRELLKDRPEGTGLWGQTVIVGDQVTVQNNNPSENLWLKIDEDFRDEGKLKKIVKNFYNESHAAHSELIEKSNEVMGASTGYKPNFKMLLESPSLWNLYFKERPDGTNGCRLEDAKNSSEGLQNISCLNNVKGLCDLYANSKKEPRKHDIEKMKSFDFDRLINIQHADKKTKEEYDLQVKLVCNTQMKVSDLVDKDGKEVNAKWTIEEFKKHLCKDKDVKVSSSFKPAIPESEISAACSAPDYSRIQGFYQRLIKRADFTAAAGLKEGDYFKYRIENMRKYLKEKSHFVLPTENEEGNILAALRSGNPKVAAEIYSRKASEDRVYRSNIKTQNALYNPGNPADVASVAKITAPVTTVNPSVTDASVQSPIAAGYIPTSVVSPAAAQIQQQIVSDEGKKIVETKKQITDLESKKDGLPPNNPEAEKFEKQIQDLRTQLAASEARYQTALDDLKKGNQVANTDNDKTVTSPNVQRNIASVPTVGTDANVVNTSGGNQYVPSGGSASLSGAGKILGGSGGAEAGNNNRALLQANNVDVNTGTANVTAYNAGLILKTVKNEQNEQVGIIADPSVFESFKNKDQKFYERYINEMLEKNIQTLIVRNGDNVLRFKLVPGQGDSYKLEEQSGQISPSEQKYFKKDLTNLLNSVVYQP